MSILSVVRYQLRPEKSAVWEGAVAKIAKRAGEKKDRLHWGCAQVAGGELGAFQIVIPAESFAEAAGRETPAALIGRLFDAKEAERLVADSSSAITGLSSAILRERPELGYASEETRRQPVAAVVTRMIVRPGHRDACEELLRKIAEAIPKTDDIRRFRVYQPLVGDLRLLAAVRPIFALAELDEATSVEELLHQAFGMAEGGLVFRAGLEGAEALTSELLLMRPDLSHAAMI